MKGRSIDWLLALMGGVLLALMIHFNSIMAKYSSPMFSSWVVHGVGALASLLFIMIFVTLFRKNTENKNSQGPLWTYLGGLPGATAVILVAITVNSSLGLSGTIALMLLGQIIFGLSCDFFGLLGIPKRKLKIIDFYVIVCVLVGSGIIIYFRA